MISIIIPIYNAEAALERMLVSVSKQTFGDYELLLINDGSTDNSEVICLEAQRNDKRIRYISQTNQGVSAARNLGIKESHGDYITFLDADDEIDTNYLYELYNACQDVDISICKVIVETEDGKITREFDPEYKKISAVQSLELLLLRKQINSGPCAKLFKKTVLDYIEFPPLRAYEDILFNVLAFSKVSSVRCINTTAYHYIQNINSAMGGFLKMPSLDIINATDSIMQFLNVNKEVSRECEYITLSHLFQYVLPMLDAKKTENSFIKESVKLYKKYYLKILKNKYFPWKEKVVYGLFCLGIGYLNGKFIKF